MTAWPHHIAAAAKENGEFALANPGVSEMLARKFEIMPAPAPSSPDSIRRFTGIAAGGMTLLIVALHFHFLAHVGGFWRDEVNLINLARIHTYQLLTHDSFPMLLPLLVNAWTHLAGHSEAALRLFGVLWGLAVVGAFWVNTWNARRTPPIMSLALFGLNAFAIIYGDALRAYGLGSALIVLVIAGMWWFLKNPTWGRAGLMAGLATLSVQALFQNAVAVAAICAAAWAVCLRRRQWAVLPRVVVIGLVAALTLLPYWTNFFPPPGPGQLLFSGFNMRAALAFLSTYLEFPFPQFQYVWAALAVLTVGCAVWALRPAPASESAATAESDLRLYAGVTLVLGTVGFFWFVWVGKLDIKAWHFLSMLALVAACLDLGLPLQHRPGRAPLFGLALATALVSVPYAHRQLKWRYTNVDVCAQQLMPIATPNDYVIVVPWFAGLTFDYYFKSATPWTTLPTVSDHSLHYWNLVHDQMKLAHPLQPIFDQITTTLQSGHRVWVVGWMGVPAPGAPVPPDLPVAPLPNSGWSDMPYTINWINQVSQFLSNHSRGFGNVTPRLQEQVNEFENLYLLEAVGWRDQPPAPNSTNTPATQP